MAVFIELWPCLLTTKLNYAQLFKWGHSTYELFTVHFDPLWSTMVFNILQVNCIRGRMSICEEGKASKFVDPLSPPDEDDEYWKRFN